MRHRALAVRPRNAGQRQWFGVPAEENLSDFTDLSGQSGYLDSRTFHMRMVCGGFIDDRRRATRKGFVEMIEAVASTSRQREKGRSRPDLTAVEDEILDFDAGQASGCRAEQFPEGHRRCRQSRHHGATSTWASISSGGSVSPSGGTAMRRKAPERIREKTGAATSPP